MSVVTLPIKKCCQCGERATRKLELVDADIGTAVDPKFYCAEHFPSPLDADDLRLLVDARDAEIEQLTRELAEVRRVQPELEAQATVRGYNDGVAEMKRKLGALNIRLGADE